MISMSSERMNHEKKMLQGWCEQQLPQRREQCSGHFMTYNRRLFDSYKVALKSDMQDETDVTRNAAYTVACEDCMHVVEGRNRNSVYGGSNDVVIGM